MAKSYFRNALLLTGCGLMVRAAGMVLRITVAAQMGSEGMGLYQLVFSLYGVSIALAVSGIGVASARLAAECLGRGDVPGARRTIARLLRVGLWLGLAAGGAQFVLAEPVARYLLGDVRAVPALRLLAFSLPFMAMGSALKGYFPAMRDVTPNVAAQCVEQLVRVGVVLWALEKTAGQGMEARCAAVSAGNLISEIASFLLSLFLYIRGGRKAGGGGKAVSLREIGAIMLPVEGGRCISSALRAVENSLVPSCLALYLGSRAKALVEFGAIRGMALPLLTFPFSFLAALAGLLMPEIARAGAAGDRSALRRMAGQTLTLTLGGSLFFAGFFAVFAGELAQLIYRDESVGKYIFLLAPVVPFFYLESMVDGMMKGLGEQLAGFRYSLWDSALRLGAVVLLLPRCGVGAFLGIIACSNVFTCLLNLRRILRVLEQPFCWGDWLVRPAFSLSASLAVCGLMRHCADGLSFPWRLLLPSGGMALAFGVLFWALSLRGILCSKAKVQK